MVPSDALFLFLGVMGALIMGVTAAARHRNWVGWGLFGGVLGVIPFIGWLAWMGFMIDLLFGAPGDDGSETSAAARAFGQGAKYAYAGGGTAIAIDDARGVLRLKNGQVTKEYPFSEIREWRTRLLTGGEIIGGGGTAALAAGGANLKNAKENRKGSGLFISVRDIDHPEWRIDMPNEQSQKRWMEILTQLVNKQ